MRKNTWHELASSAEGPRRRPAARDAEKGFVFILQADGSSRSLRKGGITFSALNKDSGGKRGAPPAGRWQAVR